MNSFQTSPPLRHHPETPNIPIKEYGRPSFGPIKPKRPGQRQGDSWVNILSTIAILILAPLFALGLITFVFQSYLVDGPSMEQTLHNSDRLIVWKLPRTWSRLTKHAYIPNRGDIVVFTEPNLYKFGQDPSKQIIKRVIALPNERLVVKDNVVTVFNSGHPDGFQPDITLPYHRIAKDTAGNIDIKIPAGHIFVAGDNRPNSLDSRSFGPVDVKNIVGKLAIRILPIGDITRF